MLAAACWGNKPLSYHMHYQQHQEIEIWVCGVFSFGVHVYTHTIVGVFCLAKGKPSHRSLGVKHKVELELPKVPAPVVKLD